MPELTLSRLKEVLEYSPVTGVFRWKVARGSRKAGEVAGGVGRWGYYRIRVDGRLYPAHRLAWMYVNGELPEHQLDHENGVRDYNQILNLRSATYAINNKNKSVRRDNTSGVTGVRWHKQCSKWQAQVMSNGKQVHLGLFERKEEAVAARKAAEKRFGFHPNHGLSKTERASYTKEVNRQNIDLTQ